MSRPTKDAQFEQAEQWLLHTFGMRMRDYANAELQAPIGVAIVEIDRVFKKAQIRNLLERWRKQDMKSNAGRKPYLDVTAALALTLLQLRTGKYTLFSDMGRTVMSMSPAQRRAIGIKHDEQHHLLYDRIGGAVYRLMALVEEFPGPKDSVPTQDQFRAIVAAREPKKMARNRERMHQLFESLLEATWAILPDEIRSRWEGNVAQDATLVPLLGKAGNPSANNLNGNRRSINYDGGFYGRNGSHAAITAADARALKNVSHSSHAPQVIKKKDGVWGVEAEVLRTIANLTGEQDSFPFVTLAGSAHIPGAIRGEGARLATSVHKRGHPLNHYVVDRAYPNGLPLEFHVPIRKLGAKLVFGYKLPDLGEQTHTADGFVMVSGRWFLDNLPNVLRNADIPIAKAEDAYEASVKKVNEMSLSDIEKAKLMKPLKHEIWQARQLYRQQLTQRAKYMLMPKGQMSPSGIRRYLIPTDAPGYKAWKAKPKTHQGTTLTMRLPTQEELDKSPRIGGVKDEQYYHHGSIEWARVSGLRNTVESTNGNAKRSQFEDLADANKRSARGNTFTYIVILLALVSENLRQIVSFFKRKLAFQNVTSKNKYAPNVFWQSEGYMSPPTVDPPPLR